MFEVLVFMFENYFARHTAPDNSVLEQELSAAGFEQKDILGAFDWLQEMTSRLSSQKSEYHLGSLSTRIFSQHELDRLDAESISFITFMQQAGVINDVERDLILDRAMALPQPEVTIEETRWITMMALWNQGREKDYLFVEDALFNPRGQTLH